MKGFRVDKNGSPLSVVRWDEETIGFDESGKEIVVNNEKPEGVVFPTDFDDIFAAMTAPIASRKSPIFKADGSYTYANKSNQELAESAYAEFVEKESADKKSAWIADYLNSSDSGMKPADGILFCDHFQDGKNKTKYELKVRNSTGDPVSFIAIVREVPYEKIPSLSDGDYDLEITKSDAGYTYTFKGKLEGYASITITGGVVSPVGNGKTDTSPELYIA